MIEYARRFEAHHAEAMELLGKASLRVAGGVAVFRELGSHANKTVNVGLDVVPTDADLDAIERFFVERGTEPKLELTAFAEHALIRRLADRGFVLFEVENVLACDAQKVVPTVPAGVTIEKIDRLDDARIREAVRVQTHGFSPDGKIDEQLFEFAVFNAKQPSCETFVALVDGRIVGAGAAAVLAKSCGLFGASVLAEHRRRGIQRALIEARVAWGAAHGADLAFVVSRPGIATERNAMRAGFVMAYARIVLVKRLAGLVPSP
jgi:GNAT superfamily N-acetyltransferase